MINLSHTKKKTYNLSLYELAEAVIHIEGDTKFRLKTQRENTDTGEIVTEDRRYLMPIYGIDRRYPLAR